MVQKLHCFRPVLLERKWMARRPLASRVCALSTVFDEGSDVVLIAGKGLGSKPHAACVSSGYSVCHGPAGVRSSLLLPDLYQYTFSWFLFFIFS